MSSRLLLAALCVVAIVGCRKPDHIRIEPKDISLRTQFDTVQLVGHVMSGTIEYPKETVTWSSQDPGIASVDERGRLKGVSGGRTRITATYKNLSASVPVDVNFVERIESSHDEVVLSYEAGDPVRPELAVIAWDGRQLRDRVLFYKPQDDKVCRVDPRGRFWPVNKGETVVVASLDETQVEIRCIVR